LALPIAGRQELGAEADPERARLPEVFKQETLYTSSCLDDRAHAGLVKSLRISGE